MSVGSQHIVTSSTALLKRWRPELASPYVGEEHLAVLRKVAPSRVFSEMCGRDEHAAKRLRRKFEDFLAKNF